MNFQRAILNCRINKVHILFSTLVDLLCPGRVPPGGERTVLDPHASGDSNRHHHHSSATVLHLSRVSTVRKSEVSAFNQCSDFFMSAQHKDITCYWKASHQSQQMRRTVRVLVGHKHISNYLKDITGQSFWLQIQRSRVRFPALPDFSEQQWVYSAS